MSEDNLALWRSVEKTDPSHTKPFKRKGGFSGTAIAPMYLIRKATEKWGPIGGKWGISIVSQEVVNGAPLLKDGEVVGNESIHVLVAELYYPTESGEQGRLPCIGQTQFVGVRSDGQFYTDEEAPKKSLTDALGNGLSKLGFSADVYMGRYDDNKYVNQIKDEFKTASLRDQSLDILRKMAPQGLDALREAWKAMSEQARRSIEADVDQMDEFKAIATQADEARKNNHAPSGAKPANA